MGKTEERQVGALLFCALSAVGAMQWTALPPWITVVTAAAAMILWRLPAAPLPEHAGMRSALGIAAAVTATLMVAVGAQMSAMAYPSAENGTVLGLLLMAVSIWAASRGWRVVLRTGAILFWFVLLLYIVIGLFSLEQVQIRPVRRSEAHELWRLALCLLPLGIRWAPKGASCGKGWHCLWSAALVLPGILCALTLGPELTTQEPFALYTLSKSVTILNVMERFEILVSAAATAGCFCLMSFAAEIALHQAKALHVCKKENAAAVWIFLLSASANLLPHPILPHLIALTTPIFWALLPLVAQGIVHLKKVEKY